MDCQIWSDRYMVVLNQCFCEILVSILMKHLIKNRLSDFKKTIDTYVKYLILDESNELNKEHFIGRSYP